MSDKQYRNEQLSCFMDGELKDTHAVTNALGNREIHACWHRYHMIRDILRDSRPIKLPSDFCVRVMQTLESEPTVFSPHTSRSRKSPFTKNIFKPVAGLAIAASAAAVTVFLLQSVYLSPVDDSLTVAANTPLKGSAKVAVNQNRDAGSAGVALAVEGEVPAGEDDSLNAYLIRHMEHASASGAGMLPYVRLAGYDNSQ